MGFFDSKPTPIELNYGESVHVLVARALLGRSILISGDYLKEARYHFVGPHGIEYCGTVEVWKARHNSVPQGVASICEEVQADYNERIAALNAAREFVREQNKLPPLFKSSAKESE